MPTPPPPDDDDVGMDLFQWICLGVSAVAMLAGVAGLVLGWMYSFGSTVNEARAGNALLTAGSILFGSGLIGLTWVRNS